MEAFSLIIAVIFISHFVGGLATFGSSLLALPLLLCISSDLKTFVLLLVLLGFLQGIQILLYTYKDIDKKEYIRICSVMGLGIIGGFLISIYLPEIFIMCLLSVVLFTSGVFAFLNPHKRVLNIPYPLKVILLLTAGITHGAFACGGAILTVYANSVFKTKESFRGTLSAVWVSMNLFLGTAFLIKHDINAVKINLLLASVVVVVVASIFAQMSANKMNQRFFFRLTSILLILSGIINISNIINKLKM